MRAAFLSLTVTAAAARHIILNTNRTAGTSSLRLDAGREINVLIVSVTGRHVSEATSGPQTLTGTSTGPFVGGVELLKRPQVFLIDFHLSVFLFFSHVI